MADFNGFHYSKVPMRYCVASDNRYGYTYQDDFYDNSLCFSENAVVLVIGLLA